MTLYEKIKSRAKAKGFDTRKDKHSGGGYWLTKADGSDLYADDNFCANLKELEKEVNSAQNQEAA